MQLFLHSVAVGRYRLVCFASFIFLTLEFVTKLDQLTKEKNKFVKTNQLSTELVGLMKFHLSVLCQRGPTQWWKTHLTPQEASNEPCDHGLSVFPVLVAVFSTSNKRDSTNNSLAILLPSTAVMFYNDISLCYSH